MAQKLVKIFELLSVSLHLVLIFGFFVKSAVQQIQECGYVNRINSLEHVAFRLTTASIGSPCPYIYQAPLDHKIEVKCWLSLDEDCEIDMLYFFDDIYASGEKFCGDAQFNRTSYLSTVSIALNSTTGSSVSCTIYAYPSDTRSCGWHNDSINAEERMQNPSAISIVKLPGNDTIYSSWELLCTGAIISHYYILTSVTCLAGIESPWAISAFISDRYYTRAHDEAQFNIYNIASIQKHPKYNKWTKVNDITILKLQAPLQWTRRLGPICLPTFEHMETDIRYLDVTGYDFNMQERKYALRKQKLEILPYIPYNDRVLKGSQFYLRGDTFQQHVCAYGGPVILTTEFEQTLVGITSNKDCTPSGFHDESLKQRVGTYITAHLYWIFAETDALPLWQQICTDSWESEINH